MPEARLGLVRVVSILGLSALTLGIGLGGSGRLTYHEAFVAQAAREMIAGGGVLVPTIDGQPWLEKPPLAVWLVALLGRVSGEVTEYVARVPSAVGASLLALGVAVFTARRFGPNVGWLAGLVQVTTFWLVVRGRLAEADILLACLVTWAMVAFDRLRASDPVAVVRRPHIAPSGSLSPRERVGVRVASGRATSLEADLGRQRVSDVPHPGPLPRGEGARGLRLDPAPVATPSAWRWVFFAALGATSLLKGLGFGAVLVGSAVATVIVWDRDRSAIRALMHPRGWVLAAALGLTWPALVAIRLPSAVSLWALHVTDRMAVHPEHFIGGPWWQYGEAVLELAMPWTPLVLVGAWPSLVRTIRGRGGVDRLLWAWAVVPILVLSTATVKNAHYAIYALPPLSVWAALGLTRVNLRLGRRGWSPRRIKLGAVGLFLALGLGSGLGHLALGPRFDHRGVEWGWTERIGRTLDPALPLVFLYEDWDRKPYPTPFGPVPHDWAVRLYYLQRPASWRQGVDDLAGRPPGSSPYALLGRERDRPSLARLGRVETLMQGPRDRSDRTFTLFRITPSIAPPDRPGGF